MSVDEIKNSGTTSAYAEKRRVTLRAVPLIGELPPHTRRKEVAIAIEVAVAGTTSAYAEKRLTYLRV
ncbi:Hypothetical protein Cul210932_1844 [Corynebacterium ulcerans]|nr:Hypothetical protein Cul210932_1844 [Corynebacterium ulcerans]ALD95561.1 Hypothetical protein Cul131001_1876 [Corynebacterium ulcerans]